MNDSKFYDWIKTFSFDAPITIVVGARGVGKTYGIREQFLKDAHKGYRFVEIVRFKSELSSIMDGYFDRLIETKAAQGKEFKIANKRAYWRRISDEKKNPYKWECIGYFVALTELQVKKKTTFKDVKRLVFDEFILDSRIRSLRYLSNEYALLANMVDSCTRENPNGEAQAPRLYLLGNSLDLINPYFSHFHINKLPKTGYSWWGGHTALLHLYADRSYGERKEEETLSGRMLKGTVDGLIAAYNDFATASTNDIAKRPKGCSYEMGLVCNGENFAVWYDDSTAFFYVDNKIDTNMRLYSMTLEDGSPNLVSLKKNKQVLDSLSYFIYNGFFRYATPRIKEGFLKAMALYGIR